MTYDEMENILSGKKRGTKTTRRGNGWIFSKFESNNASLRVCTLGDDHPRAGRRIDIDASMHFRRIHDEEVGSEVKIIDTSNGHFAVIDFTSTETIDPIEQMKGEVEVNQLSRVFLDTEHLVVLRDQLNEAIRKAKKDGALV
jgi:hypothetical protein|tara:strand:+ start:170 stop:595 length:426 start_codon:yes stop_codon:yes gene_type:complete